MGISQHTFRAYLERACYKLGALKTTHAYVAALERALITISRLHMLSFRHFNPSLIGPVAK